MLALQPVLPLNQKDAAFPDGKGMLSPTTIFNTARSFLTNTNLQHYSGEVSTCRTSASCSFILLEAVRHAGRRPGARCWRSIRGLRGDPHMGNFYLDLWRVVVYVFLPLQRASPACC